MNVEAWGTRCLQAEEVGLGREALGEEPRHDTVAAQKEEGNMHISARRNCSWSGLLEDDDKLWVEVGLEDVNVTKQNWQTPASAHNSIAVELEERD